MKRSIGASGGINAAMNPKIVIGATKGAAAIFAGIEIRDSVPESAIIIGVHIMVAAIGMAIGSGNFNFGAIKIIPAVAPTDSANPGSIA